MTTRLSVQDLLPDTEYAIRVRAVGYGTTSEWSTRRVFTTISDDVLPSIPLNPSWVVNGSSFHAEWTAVTENEQGDSIPVTRYEVELGVGGVTRIVSVPATTGSAVTFDLSFEANRALFGTPKPQVTFRVRAVDNKELKSEWTLLLTATNQPPSAPTNVVASTGNDALFVKWDESTDEDVVVHRVHVGSTAGFTPSSANKVFEGNSNVATYATATYSAHYFKVAAVDQFGQVSSYVTSNAVTPNSPFTQDTVAPDTPTALSGTITNNTNGIGARASLTWNQAVPTENDLAGFYLKYRKVGDTNYSQVNLSASGSLVSGTSYAALVELQAAHQNYEFQIKSYDWSYNESAWTATTTLTSPSNTAPAQVTGVTSVAGRDSIRYTWTASTAADLKEYEVTFSTSSTFASGNITFRTGNSATLNVGGLTPATTYYARVRAVDTSGLSGAWSATHTKATLAQLTPGDIGSPTDSEFDDLVVKVDDSVKSYSVEYAVNSSETVAPTTGWSTATPTRNPGDFIWTRTVVTYHDNTTSTTNPALLTGNTGATGSQGIQGEPGEDGVSLYTWLKYADTPTTGMSDSPVGKTYMGISYNNLSATESSDYNDYAWSLIKGADGADGADGRGITGTTVSYAKSTSGTTEPSTGWGSTIPSTTTGEFLWTRTVTTYTSGSPTTAYSVAAHGATGATGQPGADGADGADGVGITGTEIRYQKSTNGTTAPSGSWTTTIPATTTGEYLWTRTVTNFSDTTSTTAYSVAAHGATGATGQPGSDGADGVGISTTDVDYAKSTNGTTAPSTGWADTIPTTAPGEYLWTRTLTTYTDASTSTSYSVAAHGATGPDGQDGADGRGISGSTVTYQKSTSGTTTPTGTWTTAIPATSPGEFLWTRTVTEYTDNSDSTSYSVAAHGPQGPQGIEGPAGEDGQPTYTWIKYGTAQTAVDGTGMVDVPNASTTHIGIAYNETTQTESSTYSDYQWSLIQGEKGDTGDTGPEGPEGPAGADGSDGADGISVTSITPYFKTVTTGAGEPEKPTTATPSGWSTTEPDYVYNTELYRTDKVSFSDNSFLYTDVTKVSSYAAAVSAMESANGVNRVFWSADPATGTSAGGRDFVAGDTWFQRDANGKVIGQWEFTTSWQSRQINHQMIASIDVGNMTVIGKLTAANIEASTLTIGQSQVTGLEADLQAAQETADAVETLTDGWTYSGTTEINGGAIRTDTIDVIKLKAGSTFTQNLNVKSTFVLGDASTSGVIRSYDYVADSAGFSLSSAGLEINEGAVKADALRAGTIGSDTGTIDIAAGASLVLNGGVLKSNTYDSSGGTAGFSLSDAGLVIKSGSVSASALTAGMISGTNTITLSGANAKIVGTGFSLSGTGLSVTSGTIAAAALQIQDSANIIPSIYASFENASYTGLVTTGNLFSAVGTDGGRFGTNYLAAAWPAAGADPILYLGTSNTDYNTNFDAGATYILSAYVRVPLAATTVRGKIKWSNGTTSAAIFTANPTAGSSAWTRYSGTVVVPAGVTKGIILFDSPTRTANSGFHIDGVQVEKKIGALNTPSQWKPPGTTSINGGMIRTGEIRSSNVANITKLTPIYDDAGNQAGFGNPETIVDPDGRPAFIIDAEGDAEFSNLAIRGNVIVGVPDGGPDGSTTVLVDLTASTTAGSPTITGIEGTFKPAYIGTTITAPELPGGTEITDVSINGDEATLSQNATTTATDATLTLIQDAVYSSILQSANYEEGYSGWALRSDGTVEFRSVALNSLDGGSIIAGSLRAESISSGSLDADITVSGTFETSVYEYEVEVSVTAGSTVVTRVAGDDWPTEDIGAGILGEGIPPSATITEISAAVPSEAQLSEPATVTSTGIKTVRRGRRVVVSSQGIVLEGPSGGDVVRLPTAIDEPAVFSGSVEATDLFVHDEFRMYGQGNSLGQASELHLNAGEFIAPAPKLTNSYESDKMYNIWSGENVTISGNAYQNDSTGLAYDTQTGMYYYTTHFFGASMERVYRNSWFHEPGGTGMGVNLRKVFNEGEIALGGVKVVGDTFYFFTKQTSNDTWRLYRVTRAGMERQDGPLASDRIGYTSWRSNDYGSLNGNPAFDVYNGDAYVAKLNNNNDIVLYKYNGLNIQNQSTFQRVRTKAAGSIASLNVGQFDMGGPVYAVVTTQNGSASTRQNYVFEVTASSFNYTDFNFPLVSNHNGVGLTWIGTSNDDATGYFSSISLGGNVYKYTGYGANNPSPKVYVSSKWWNSTENKFGPESTVATYNITRRAGVSLSSPVPIPNSGGSSPDSVAFYMSTGSTRYRLPLPGPGVTSITADDIPISGTFTEVAMPAGIPSKLLAGTNLEISGDGFVRTNRLVLQSTLDANTNSGNTPPLMVGNPSGQHLRIDGNEIVAMSNDTTQATLNINSGGFTTVKDLNVLGDFQGNTRFAGNINIYGNTLSGTSGSQISIANLNVTNAVTGATKFTGSAVDFPNAPTGSFASNANLSPGDGRLRRDTSSRRYKENEAVVNLDVEQILSIKPKKFQRNDHIIPQTNEFVGYREDNPWYYGFIAEDAYEAGLHNWVVYDVDSNGEVIVDGFAYDKWVIAQQAVLQEHHAEVKNLKQRNAELEDRLAAIEAHLGL